MPHVERILCSPWPSLDRARVLYCDRKEKIWKLKARVLLCAPRRPWFFWLPLARGFFVVLLRSYSLARWKRRWACNLLDKQMHQTMLQMCAAPICAAHHTCGKTRLLIMLYSSTSAKSYSIIYTIDRSHLWQNTTVDVLLHSLDRYSTSLHNHRLFSIPANHDYISACSIHYAPAAMNMISDLFTLSVISDDFGQHSSIWPAQITPVSLLFSLS